MVLTETDSNLIIEEKTEELKTDSLKPFSIEILKLLKDVHQQHGLRHGDYQRYRGYCSRRVRRLRKVLKLPQGDRRHFKKRDVTDVHINNAKADERYLHVPLVLAERNWAYAMQLRQEANTEPRKKFHLIQKMRKACAYALQLEELCKLERCDARTKLESQAYVAWMHGTLHFELQLWEKANENLKRAQVIYEKLASALPEDEQLPYRQKVDEIAPSLRYCAYNIGEDKAVDLLELRSQGILENFEALVAQKKEKTTTILQEIKWFDLKVLIRHERVRLFLASIENLNDSIDRAEDTQAKIKIIEDMFIDLRDIISLVRDEVRNDPKEQIVLSYLLAIRIERTVQRNLLLIQQTRRSQDVCRLFDIIIQQINELMSLDGLKDEKKAQSKYSQELLAYKSLRAFYMGKTHITFRRWKEASYVFNVSEKLAKDMKSNQYPSILKEMVVDLAKNAALERSVALANLAIEKYEEIAAPIPQKAHKSKKPLAERLDEFREDPQLLSKNPNVINVPFPVPPIEAKPLFYDLALNHVQFPPMQEKAEEQAQQKQGSSGITGFVKGLWGWGKK
ncbi:signal recognition particle 68 kda protein [Holotrichia oblita]|uniref:Signal recognition particle 68 kDa protein n=2 Tax=Holotrichia oblita TaxID=644536 RepID=A0ACB9SP59_HOLOL|nr:signal recognition particle 68 kda protein [Holotrichia oblita]KAI4456993.1 signal recognition particle 68 kda protein [Holotrichia oblita]